MSTENLQELVKQSAHASQYVHALRDGLIALGITTEKPCDPQSLLDKISELTVEIKDSIKEDYDSIFSKAGADSLLSLLAIPLKILGNTTLSVLEVLVSEFVNGALIGTFYSLISVLLTTIPGMELIIQYLGVKTLKAEITYRIRLNKLLTQDLYKIITVIQSYQNIFQSLGQTNWEKLSSAAKEVADAEQLLGRETSRLYNDEDSKLNSIQVENIELSQYHLDRALDHISESQLKVLQRSINQTLKRFSFTRDLPAMPSLIDPGNWLKFFEDLSDALFTKLFKYESLPGTPERDVEVASKKAELNTLLRELIPILPKTLQVLLLQKTFASASNRLFEKFPIYTTSIVQTTEWKKELDDYLINFANNMSLNFGFGEAADPYVPRFFTDENTKDLNLRVLTDTIKLQEAVVLLTPSMWRQVRNVGFLYKDILTGAIKSLKLVRNDITDTVTERPGYASITKKRLEWASKILYVKGELDQISNPYTGMPAPGHPYDSISGPDVANLIEQAGLYLENLKQFILLKSYDVKTGKTRREPMEQALTLAQKALTPLYANLGILLTPSGTNKVLANLQSLRILMETQLKLDQIELQYTGQYLSYIESSDVWANLYKIFEDSMGLIINSPANHIADSILTGDLSPIVSFYEFGETGLEVVTDIKNIFSCEGETEDKPPWYMDSLLAALNPAGLAEDVNSNIMRLQEEIQKTLNNIEDKKEMLETQLLGIQDRMSTAIDKIGETKNSFNSPTLDAEQFENFLINTPLNSLENIDSFYNSYNDLV